MVKPIMRKANARGLDRSALARAKTKVGLKGIDSSRTAPSDAAREKMFTTGLNLTAEGSALQSQSAKIHNDAIRGVVKRPKSKDDGGRR
jgi:hypothetical protein